ncbi:hypothetical protein SAMN04487819_1293 [Actinopolyspora alba]|uniref:Uncharacterized protein n=1 Tax=Actinopolyspora alba TaxID=673379 RepID=A0A1I2CPK5_9ACTN|nr:hypothetical protein [Actinopolyspora alba]SFE69733.1 hypothetical protein SAMN04487819_1293 [Actinopolyspora alba]
MSSMFPATVRVISQHAHDVSALSTPDDLTQFAGCCEALAELTTGAVAREWSRLAQRYHSRALMLRAEQDAAPSTSSRRAS